MNRSSEPGSLQAIEAERAIVAALFGDGSAESFFRLQLILKPEDFFVAAHGLVFRGFSMLVEEGVKAPDPATLSAKVSSLQPVTDELRALLSEALVFPFHPENIEEYGRAVVEKARARQIKRALDDLAGKAGLVGGEITSADLVREIEAAADGFSDTGQKTVQLLETPHDALRITLEHLERVSAGEITGVNTGIEDVDERLGGAQPGELIIIGARPSMGKTAFALGWQLNACRDALEQDEGALCPFFSLEMPTTHLVQRCLANLGNIDHERLRKGRLTDEEYDRLGVAISKYAGLPLHIDTDPLLTPALLRHKLRLLMRQEKRRLRMVMVDYLQLMESDRTFENNKVAEVGEVSKHLKRIAKEFEVPVVALAQLSRKVEERSDKRPTMADLRESGSIEQDADTIMFLYRDEYYNPDSSDKGLAEIITAKGRNGSRLGTAKAAFRGEYVRFETFRTGHFE